MLASSTRAFLHLVSLHGVYEHVRGGVLPFCGYDCHRHRGIHACVREHALHHICDRHDRGDRHCISSRKSCCII